MPSQDLTPQLRIRLRRVERLVGLFLTVAVVLLLGGLGYYVYRVAERKGWFLRKMPYFTFVRNATGLKVGAPVKLMGFDAGEITRITAQPPDDPYFNVYVAFRVYEPFYGYLWEDSRARVVSANLLGDRYIEITKGTNGAPTYMFHQFEDVPISEAESLAGTPGVEFGQEKLAAAGTGFVTRVGWPLTEQTLRAVAAEGLGTIQVVDKRRERRQPTGIWNEQVAKYLPIDVKTNKGYFLLPDEAPALTERAERIVTTAETALPNILSLTNSLQKTLAGAARATERADELLAETIPVVTNLEARLEQTLFTANSAFTNASLLLTNTDARLASLESDLTLTIENLANLTSNLNAQVQANSNMLGSISSAVVHADDLMQGLKRHWLLRSAFKEKKTNQPAKPPASGKRAR